MCTWRQNFSRRKTLPVAHKQHGLACVAYAGILFAADATHIRRATSDGNGWGVPRGSLTVVLAKNLAGVGLDR